MRYLIVFATTEHHNFKIPELDSILELNNLTPNEIYNIKAAKEDIDLTHLIANFPSEEMAIRVAKRAVLIKSIHEVWGNGVNYDDLIASVKNTIPSKHMEKFTNETISFSMVVRGYGFSLSSNEQQAIREKILSNVTFKGPVKLKNPDATFHVILKYAVESELQLSKNSAVVKSEPKALWFTRYLSEGGRSLEYEFTLKKRKYLGPTSMSSELGFLMANQGLCKRGSLVLDPFVGTGSILVACTQFGAHCMGTDIDIRVLRGQIKGELTGKTPFTNFEQYGLFAPDMLRLDTSNAPTRCISFFDAIICDPPYGIRAGARKSGSNKTGDVKPVPLEKQRDHIPKTQPYEVHEVMIDLLDNAAKWLIRGGRLVYLLPSPSIFDIETQLPRHPLLELVSHSEEQLTLSVSRRLITMKKIGEYNLSKTSEYKSQCALTVGKFSLEDADNLYKTKVEETPHLLSTSRRATRARHRKALRETHRLKKKCITNSTSCTTED